MWAVCVEPAGSAPMRLDRSNVLVCLRAADINFVAMGASDIAPLVRSKRCAARGNLARFHCCASNGLRSAFSAPRPLGREVLLIPLMVAQCGDVTSFDKAHAPRITGARCGTQRHTRRRARRRPYLL